MSRNPYERDGQPPRLQHSVFAFVDILGYRDLVCGTHGQVSQQDLLVQLHKALSSSREWIDIGDSPEELEAFGGKDRFALKAFTDNIAIGWPIKYRDGESEFGLAFGDLADFQLTMVNAGFFIRGAISVGDVYVDEIAVFGDALMESHRGESSLARDPRIVLTQSARQSVRNHLRYYRNGHHAPQNRDVMRDTDGQWFLNYLDTILIAEETQGPFFGELERHRASVQSKLDKYRQSPPIFAKYSWTAGYHNFFCDLHGFHDYKIALDSFSGDRGFIVDDV